MNIKKKHMWRLIGVTGAIAMVFMAWMTYPRQKADDADSAPKLVYTDKDRKTLAATFDEAPAKLEAFMAALQAETLRPFDDNCQSFEHAAKAFTKAKLEDDQAAQNFAKAEKDGDHAGQDVAKAKQTEAQAAMQAAAIEYMKTAKKSQLDLDALFEKDKSFKVHFQNYTTLAGNLGYYYSSKSQFDKPLLPGSTKKCDETFAKTNNECKTELDLLAAQDKGWSVIAADQEDKELRFALDQVLEHAKPAAPGQKIDLSIIDIVALRLERSPNGACDKDVPAPDNADSDDMEHSDHG